MRSGITVDRLVKRYGTRVVLDGMTVSAAPGEVVGLLGPNGVGKSTTLRIAAAIDRPDGGAVHVAGIDALEYPEQARRCVGYLPDVGGLLPRLSVAEHLELAARLWGLRQWKQRRDELVEQLDLGGVIDTAAGALSHGLSRRCGLAVATLARPSVLLLDEPFDGVDPFAAVAVRDVVAAAAGDGAAVICSTHLLDTAARLCSRLVIVGAGQVLASGTPAQVAPDGDLEAAYLELMRGRA
jgi:ABC-2 type transport system ATP-binding protein